MSYSPRIYKSIQRGSITISGATSNTATITSVDTNYSRLRFLGFKDPSATTDTADKVFVRLTFTNATTITASVTTAPGTSLTVYFEVTEYKASALRSTIQRGTITCNSVASNTATITSVTTSKSEIDNLGNTATSATGPNTTQFMAVELTNSTTVTAYNGSGGGNNVVGYQVVEFK